MNVAGSWRSSPRSLLQNYGSRCWVLCNKNSFRLDFYAGHFIHPESRKIKVEKPLKTVLIPGKGKA